MSLSFFGKIEENFKDGRLGVPFFFPVSKVLDQHQTNGISKRFDAQQRDCTQIINFLTKIKMLINFLHFSK